MKLRFMFCVAIAATLAINLLAQTPTPTPKNLLRGKTEIVETGKDPAGNTVWGLANPPKVRRRVISPVVPTEQPLTATFVTDKAEIHPGESTNLRWDVAGKTNAVGISIPGEDTDPTVITDAPDHGQTVVTPAKTTAYQLYARNAAGTVTKVVVVSVIPTPTPALSWYETWGWWQWLLLLLLLALLGWLLYRLFHWLIERDRHREQQAAAAPSDQAVVAATPSPAAVPATTLAHAVQAPAGGLVTFTININVGQLGNPPTAVIETTAATSPTSAQPEPAANPTTPTAAAAPTEEPPTTAQSNETNT